MLAKALKEPVVVEAEAIPDITLYISSLLQSKGKAVVFMEYQRIERNFEQNWPAILERVKQDIVEQSDTTQPITLVFTKISSNLYDKGFLDLLVNLRSHLANLSFIVVERDPLAVKAIERCVRRGLPAYEAAFPVRLQ